jgi:CheY-like chemotaxis protein/HPt (histidine-containing phosphotransfer) domain-containing protein
MFGVLEEVAESLALQAHEKGLKLACAIAPDVPPRVRGDAGRLRQAIVNLGNNAIKFTEHGEILLAIELEAETPHGVKLRFAVTDTGIGISQDRLGDLFSPFTQLDGSTTRKYGGTGLGLALSKRLAEMMGGAIGVESVPGRGSTFWFSAVFKASVLPPVGAVPALDLSAARILIADAHPASRSWARRLLSSWHARCAEAMDGPTAIALLSQAAAQGDPFKIALVDASLPGTNGDGWNRCLRETRGLANLRLVLLSPLGCQGSTFTPSDFSTSVTKPLRRSRLGECLSAIVSDSRSEDDVEISAARDPAEKSVLPGLRILVAEDNSTNQLVALATARKLGCKADAVANGREALEALRVAPYDLVLMDCQMPEMDGFEAARRIRSGTARVLNRDIAIIALTARAMEGDRARCAEAGMNGYLLKPLDPTHLAAALSRWTARAQIDSSFQSNLDASAPLVFDRAGLLRRVVGDERLAASVVRSFLEEVPGDVEDLGGAVARRQFDRVQGLSHRIRGAALSAGCAALADAAGAIEEAANVGSITEVESLLPPLQRHFDALRKLLADPAAVTGATLEKPER